MRTKIFYDEEYDSLLISNKADNERVKINFMFDDIVISLTGRGKIVSIEIRDASKYLKETGFNPEILKNIEDAELIVLPKRDFIFIGVKIISRLQNCEYQRIPVANIPAMCLAK